MGGTWFSFYFHSALPSFPSWFLPSPLSSLFPLRGIARELPKKFSDDSRKDIQPQSRYLRVSRLSRIFTLQDRPFAQASIKDMHPAEESINVCLDRDTSIERKRARNVYPESRRTASSSSIYYETPAASRDALSIRRETGLRPARNRAYNSANFTAWSLYSSASPSPCIIPQRSLPTSADRTADLEGLPPRARARSE